MENGDEYELMFQDNNNKFHWKLDWILKIEELRKIMGKRHKLRYYKRRQKTNNMLHLIAQVYISKINERLQNKVGKPK